MFVKLALFFLLLLEVSALELSSEQKEYLSNKKSITMCVDPDWEPFEIINKDGRYEGIAADLIALVSLRIGIKIEVVKTKDWDETLQFSKARKCDLLSFVNDTPKRREWLTFTKPIFEDPNVLVGRTDMKYIEDVSKINSSVALPRGTAIAERFANNFKNLTIIPTDSERESFKLVEGKKADLTLRSMIVTAYTIKKEGLFNLKIVGDPKGYENILRIGVRGDEPILRDILDRGIDTLSKEDTEAIINKFVTIKVEKVTTLTIAAWIFFVLVLITLIVFLINYFLQKKIKIEVAKNLAQAELLMQQNRKAELGGLIANISHQWKNGLNKISSTNLQMLVLSDMGSIPTAKEIKTYAMDIENSILFMSQTMDIFLNFYKENQKKELFAVSEAVREALTIVDAKIKADHAQINIDIINDIEITGIKNEWIHVWLNLINNSLKAAREMKKPIVKITVNSAEIVYKDNCGGFDEETLRAITNNIHSGLGIKMSKNILKKYNYAMNISNHEDGVQIVIFKDETYE